MRVTQDQRSPGSDEIEKAVTVFIDHPAPLAASDEERITIDSGEGTNRRVHSARNALSRLL